MPSSPFRPTRKPWRIGMSATARNSLAISAALILILAFHVSTRIRPSFTPLFGLSSPWQTANSTTSRTYRHPRPISDAYTPPSFVPSFATPHVVALHVRREGNLTKIRIVTNGIHMGPNERNLSAIGCLIGHTVHPADVFVDDVLHCSVNGTVPTGVRMSPVLHKDKRYKEQLGRNTTLVTGVIVFLGAADVRELPNNVEIMPGVGQKRWELVSVARDAVLRSEVESEEAVKLRYGICLMTQIAPGAEMLHAWVNYHRRIGVDHVYVFDNGAKKEYMDLLRGREDVEVVPWPFHKSQLQVVSYFLFLARDRCRHVVLSDVDEYVMLGVNDYDKTRTGWRPLQKYVGKMQRAGYNNVKFPYVTMRNSGYRRRPAAETVEAYVHRKKDQDYLNGKSLCTTDDNYQSGMIHSCGRVGVGMKGRQASLFREWVPHQWNESFVDLQTWRDVALVVHYRERSWEDWIDKMNAGWVSGALVADTESGKLSIDKPPEWYMHVSDELRWEGFRNIYRRVTKWEPGTVRLVYSRAGRGCIVEEGRDSCAKSD